MSRFLVSAVHKSSGKTTVSVGIAAALAARGIVVQTFKKGPDYIDPLWHTLASGRPCYNLDFHTETEDEIIAAVAARTPAGAVALIEGNMGLHDGIDLEGADSTAALARLLDAPIVLVIDAEGMTRGVAPLLNGTTEFDPALRFAGVVLNRVASPRQQAKLVAAIERYSDVKVLGCLGRDPELMVVERHLGLTTPSETAGRDARIARLVHAVEASIDLDAVLAAAATVHPLPVAVAPPVTAVTPAELRIGVARDSAFCFYYPDDLEALERHGATLVPFSPLTDTRLPDVDALFIGGGFPETHMRQLEANGALRQEILAVARAGMPIHAECGGLMYLSRSITWHGETCQMVGALPADTIMHDRPQGRGLVVLEPTGLGGWVPTAGSCETIPAHEFHHAALVNLDREIQFAYRVRRGTGIDGEHDGLIAGNVLASFSHLRDTSRNRWTRRFVDFVRGVRDQRRDGAMKRAAGS